MSATSIPIFQAGMFALEGKERSLEILVPVHEDRRPSEGSIDPSLWAVEGIVAIGSPERILLAANIDDVEVPDPTSESGKRKVDGSEIAALFIASRFGKLSQQHPHVDLHQGDEVLPVAPQSKLIAVYQEGLNALPESVPSLRVAEPVGRIATGTNSGINPIPTPAFNTA